MEKPTVDVNLINPFVKSVLNVFKTMVQTELKRTSLSIKTSGKAYGEIFAIIGLAGSGSGNVVLCFPAIFAGTLVAQMLGCDGSTLSKSDIKDGIGEIANMVAGSAKSEFSGTQYSFNISLPTVIEAESNSLEIDQKKDTPCIVVGFESNSGQKFLLEVSLKSNIAK